ncbi:MAG: type III-A CRISPR-associated RAMP protein Csm5 [Candidatus Cloacimonadota bacterium]|nr:MAG: type III-A CRISPR-associated RAMP protein Csm5 [Candidatus Cloacimonadota bacterium]PIE78641.1 MAG: type III-A CRISPR-associated RAMP protein Csm5 [Candidatus Delongbacteria bacterium]
MNKIKFTGGDNKLQIISPIHIGSGDVYSPLDYYCGIEEEEEDFSTFFYFNSEKLLEKMFKAKAIDLKVLDSGNFRLIRKKFYEYLTKNEDLLEELSSYSYFASKKLYYDYRNAINNPKNESKMEIQRVLYNPLKNKHIIPGSSLKGSLRTAVLSYLANKFRSSLGRRSYFNGNDFEKDVVGKINEDPFNSLIIGDIETDPLDSTIVEARELKKNPKNKNRTPKGFYEVINYNEEESLKFSIVIQDSMIFRKLNNFKIKSVDQLKKISADFYYNKFSEEYDKFYDTSHDNADFYIDDMNDIKDKLFKAKESGKGILRVGHFSHAECMSIDNFRKIKGKYIKSLKKEVHGTTRTLADGYFPFGWVIWE